MQEPHGTGPLLDVAACERLRADGALIVDVRFDLKDIHAGRRQYAEGHIPDAVFLDLEDDLCGPIGDRRRGRHPLPEVAALEALFSRLGVHAERWVVAYDAGVNVYAARLWWTLRFVGHDRVAVLDGGMGAWQAAGRELQRSVPRPPPATRFVARVQHDWVVDAAQAASAPLLVDSRERVRYLGEAEPIDPVAGRIPGAVHRFHGSNLREGGGLRDAASLRAEFGALLDGRPVRDAVFYCGSGVSACNNLLAMAHAGLGMARLYPGSWSEWCADPARPLERGEPGPV